MNIGNKLSIGMEYLPGYHFNQPHVSENQYFEQAKEKAEWKVRVLWTKYHV